MNDHDMSTTEALPFLKAWDNYAAACQTLFERLKDGSAAHGGGVLPFSFVEPWKDFAASLGLRADLAAGQQFKPEDLYTSHLPALGLTREYQEIGRRMQELGVQFQRRCAQFAQTGADIGQSALQAVQKRCADDAALQGAPAALYDAWIDCAEEAFARAAHGDEFARLLAELCNILSAFKIERGKLLEALARHLDLPSRAEVDSLHRQVRVLTAAARAAPDKPAAKEPAHTAASAARPARRKVRKRTGK
jgi:class III poly(R)-hydroxyalkanoic acid synthase PhaE subunit